MYSSTLSLTSKVDGGWVVNDTPRPFYPRERHGTHCIGGWVGPRAGLDSAENLAPPPGFEPPDRPARSESLYRLSYPGPLDTAIRCPMEEFMTNSTHQGSAETWHFFDWLTEYVYSWLGQKLITNT